MHLRPERDRILDGEARIERGVAVLEHHLHPPAQLAQRQRRADRLAVEDDLADVRLDQADHEPRGGRLAAAGLADDAEHLALVDREAHVVDRAHHAAPAEQAAAELEVLAQGAHLEQRLLRAADVGDRREQSQPRTSIALRKPSLNRLKQIDTMKIITPGSAATHGLR